MSIASRLRQRKTGGWARTIGGKHRWKKAKWLPTILNNGVAAMKSRTLYSMERTGWRRLKPEGSEANE